MPNNDITNKLKEIAGTEICDKFGEPFIKIFEQAYNGKKEEVLTAAYTCSLFLSSLLTKMPTTTLHTFIYYTKERYSRFSFNCNMYETLFDKIESKELENTPLLDKEKKITTYSLTKQDIFEAFDFYTNQ
ncbi:MAG: hypothetical protein J6U58_03255 [Bacteroidaceae bacterium]|nr:hypothetical protein [Bacteroidaceae bacterium]